MCGDKKIEDNVSDLDAFKPSPSLKKIDDKAAFLEKEIASIKSNFNRERVTYHFVIGLLLNIVIWVVVDDSAVEWLSLIGTVIVLYATAKWLDHPWMGDMLGKWHDLFYDACKHRFKSSENDKLEPLSNENQTEKNA